MIRLIVKMEKDILNLAKHFLKNPIMTVNLAKNHWIGFVTFPAVFQLVRSDKIVKVFMFERRVSDGYFY